MTLEHAKIYTRIVDILHERSYGGMRGKLIKLGVDLARDTVDDEDLCSRPTSRPPAPPPADETPQTVRSYTEGTGA